MKTKKVGGRWMARVGSKWVAYDPPDAEVLREAEAVAQQRKLGNMSGHSCYDGGRGKKCGNASRNANNVERVTNNALHRKYIVRQV